MAVGHRGLRVSVQADSRYEAVRNQSLPGMVKRPDPTLEPVTCNLELEADTLRYVVPDSNAL
jgi:hypothetical protein